MGPNFKLNDVVKVATHNDNPRMKRWDKGLIEYHAGCICYMDHKLVIVKFTYYRECFLLKDVERGAVEMLSECEFVQKGEINED